VAVTASEGLVVIAPAGDVLSVQQSGCAFTFTVDGDTATMEPDQVCAAWAIQIPMWSLTLQPDGSLQETLGGRIWLDGGPCTVSGKSTLTRD
jgi:hypothetical protein